MLAIISDLHLTDGTSGEIISDSAFRLFKNRLSDMAYDASWRINEQNPTEKFYKPIESFDIILLGDILDMIRSEKWNDAPPELMPWHEPRSDEFFTLADKIVTDILSFNKASFDILKGIAGGDLKIPESMTTASDQKKKDEKIKYEASKHKITLKVNIYYMVGNHDWFLFSPDERMNPIRNKVIEALGLANQQNVPFPHTRADSKAIEDTQNAHKIFAEHGDGFDPTNFQSPNRDLSSIGDVVVIKILNAIPSKAAKLLDKSRTPENTDEIDLFIKELHEIDNLRPYALAPDWISDLMKKTKLSSDIIDDAIGQTLKEVIKDFTESELIAKDFWLKVKMKIFRLILPRKLNIKQLGKLLDHTSISKDKPESYRKYALATSNNKELDFFIMGHTHYAEVVPLYNYSNKIDGHTYSKIYLNTGTWRTVHFKGLINDDFISFKTMTIAGFYKEDERSGRTFEFWTGSLAL